MSSVHPRWMAKEIPYARIVAFRGRASGAFGGSLTTREEEVLRTVCECGIPGAADCLSIAVMTVKNHLTRIYKKLGLAGDFSGKQGTACYRLGRHDERTGQGR